MSDTTTPTKNESLPELPEQSETSKPRYVLLSADLWWDHWFRVWPEDVRKKLSHHDLQRMYRAVIALTTPPDPLTREAPTEGVDVEAMLVACVPGGSSVDPQTVADNIREWFATPPAPQRQSSNPSGLSSESAPLSSEQRLAQGVDMCESRGSDCGPVTRHDSDGTPLCDHCWNQLEVLPCPHTDGLCDCPYPPTGSKPSAWISDNDLLKLRDSVDEARNIRMTRERTHLRVHPIYIPALTTKPPHQDRGEDVRVMKSNPKARYWEERANFWRGQAIAHGYKPPGEEWYAGSADSLPRKWLSVAHGFRVLGDEKGAEATEECARELTAALTEAKQRGLGDVVPSWIVNDLGELGVMVNGVAYFLYKGESLIYHDAVHDDGSPMLYRMVGKREFGETCWPLKWIERGRREDRYTEKLVYTHGLSFGEPKDGDWRPLPTTPQVEAKRQTGEGADHG